MKYSVVAEDGRCIGEAAFAAGAESGQGGEGGGDGSGIAGGATAVREFLSGRMNSDMLRMANQSIFADMLEVRVFGRHVMFFYLLGPLVLAAFCKV